MKKRRKQSRSTPAAPSRRGPAGAASGPSAPTTTTLPSRGVHRFPWALGLAIIICFSVILSECLVVYRTAIVPAREQSSSVRRVGDETGRPVATSESEPRYFLDFDGYYWVTYARRMVSEKELRVHWTDLDDAPFGRPVHWSSVFSWWLILLGGVHAVASGLSVDSAIGAAAYYANPVLMGLMLCAVGWMVYRRLGNRASFLLVILLGLQPALLRDFGFGRPDHHGLHLICALGVVLLAVLGGGGWVLSKDDSDRPRSKGKGKDPDVDGRFAPGPLQARRWFIASGIIGGCGLWIGATQQALIIGCIGIGAFFAMIGATRPVAQHAGATSLIQGEQSLRWTPELWRLWSRVGALTSLLAYVIEYFPGDMGMQLEVNHPLYSLAWFCAGELLYCIAKCRLAGTPLAGYPAAKLLLMVGGISLVPALAYWGPVGWYVLKDPLMLRMHSVIGEFQPLVNEVQSPWALAGELAPALLVFIGIGLLVWFRKRRLLSTLLAISVVPALVIGVMFLVQVRWGGLFTVASCVLAVPLYLVATGGAPGVTRSRVAAVVVLIAVSLQIVPNAAQAISRADDQPGGNSTLLLADEVFARDIALVLGASVKPGVRPLTIMAGLGEGSRIHFFGQIRAPGSLYWENIDGVRDTVDFFADHGEDEALRIARDREVEYIVVTTDIVSMVQMLKHDNNDIEGIQKTLAYRLIRPENGVPSWCRPVRIKGFRWTDRCRIYRVTGLD